MAEGLQWPVAPDAGGGAGVPGPPRLRGLSSSGEGGRGSSRRTGVRPPTQSRASRTDHPGPRYSFSCGHTEVI